MVEEGDVDEGGVYNDIDTVVAVIRNQVYKSDKNVLTTHRKITLTVPLIGKPNHPIKK